MGDTSLNIYVLRNAIGKAVCFPSTRNIVKLQRIEKERKKEERDQLYGLKR